MKKFVFGTLMALMLIAAVATPVMAAEQTSNVAASVTVNEVISATITDNDPSGVQFGDLAKGTSDNPEAAQGASQGAVTIVVAPETSVNCNIQVKASDFSDGSNTLAITNAKYGTTNVVGSATAFAAADTYYTIGSHTVGGSSTTVEAYHWLSIPTIQVAGAYTSTFTYRVGN